jgi:hypothetical protein
MRAIFATLKYYPILDSWTTFRHGMEAYKFGKMLEYPDGSYDLIAGTRQVFCETKKPVKKKEKTTKEKQEKPKGKKDDLDRARSRARANVRRLALCNDFKYFVTLTINPEKIDSYDVALVTKRMNQWASNQVKRKGLKYILVPEFHQSGRVHYHGFFNDALEVVDSKIRDSNGHIIYNLPGWTYGFTTAIELYGDYHAAIAYTCKYIGKNSEKIGGRWYYSGGDLIKPVEKPVDISYGLLMDLQTEEFKEEYGTGWVKATPNGIFAGINGLNKPIGELL